jgi:hypothetical protein
MLGVLPVGSVFAVGSHSSQSTILAPLHILQRFQHRAFRSAQIIKKAEDEEEGKEEE